jgi:hypothetical protein
MTYIKAHMKTLLSVLKNVSATKAWCSTVHCSLSAEIVYFELLKVSEPPPSSHTTVTQTSANFKTSGISARLCILLQNYIICILMHFFPNLLGSKFGARKQ